MTFTARSPSGVGWKKRARKLDVETARDMYVVSQQQQQQQQQQPIL
jgi:hypothetical protein